MAEIRLAAGTGPPKAFKKGLTGKDKPGILVSFYYLREFLRNREHYDFRDWVMDSGAFSAHNSGAKIDLKEYIATCLELTEKDPQLVEIFALDVIGDWKSSLKNTRTMWKAGVEAIPTFHPGEPWKYLEQIAREYPKIALGGVVGVHMKRKLQWVGQCFARVWPKRVHGFGMCGEEMVMTYPFESVDSTNWELGPCAFGRWQTFGALSVRGGGQNLRSEVEHFLQLEKKSHAR